MLSKKYPLLFLMFLCALYSNIYGQGIEIDSVKESSKDALHIDYTSNDGVQINHAGQYGINIQKTDRSGIVVFDAGRYGFYVDEAGINGIHVNTAVEDGIHVAAAGGYSMNIMGDKNETGTFAKHVAQITNLNTGVSPDVLALKVGTVEPGTGVNFITFYSNGGNTAVGRIEGNGSGGVLYESVGADFAEMLPVSNSKEELKPGDIIALHDGHISLDTEGAHGVMVITDRPVVLGNQQAEPDDFEMVSFIGQVPVKVRGTVRAGDWIVSSGMNDGIGISKSSDQIDLEDQIVGQALESSDKVEIKRVNTIVGLDHSQAIKDHLLKDMQSTIRNQERRIIALNKELAEIKELILAK